MFSIFTINKTFLNLNTNEGNVHGIIIYNFRNLSCPIAKFLPKSNCKKPGDPLIRNLKVLRTATLGSAPPNLQSDLVSVSQHTLHLNPILQPSISSHSGTKYIFCAHSSSICNGRNWLRWRSVLLLRIKLRLCYFVE